MLIPFRPENPLATPADVRAAREARGMDALQFAVRLGVTELEVSAWEAGAVSVPRRAARTIRRMRRLDAWKAERRRLDEAADKAAPSCEWVLRERAALVIRTHRDPAIQEMWDRIAAHEVHCAVCQARRAMETRKPVPAAPGVLGWLRARGPLGEAAVIGGGVLAVTLGLAGVGAGAVLLWKGAATVWTIVAGGWDSLLATPGRRMAVIVFLAMMTGSSTAAATAPAIPWRERFRALTTGLGILPAVLVVTLGADSLQLAGTLFGLASAGAHAFFAWVGRKAAPRPEPANES